MVTIGSNVYSLKTKSRNTKDSSIHAEFANMRSAGRNSWQYSTATNQKLDEIFLRFHTRNKSAKKQGWIGGFEMRGE